MELNKENTSQHPNYHVLTIILFWCGLVVVASNYLTIPLMSIFSEVFQASFAHVAWVGSAFSLCYAVGSLFSGPLSDRFGRKQVMFIGLLMLTVSTFAVPIFSNLSWVIALRSIQGLAAASFAPVAIAYIVDKFPARKRVTAIGFTSSSFLISAIAGQIFSSTISQQFGWQSVFYYSGSIYLFTAVLVLFLLPKTDIEQASSKLMALFQQFQTLLADKSLIQAYSIAITLLLSFVAFYTVLGDYLTKKFDLNEDGVLYVRMVGMIGMLFAPFAGKLANKYNLLTVLRGSLTVGVIGIFIVGMSTNLFFLVAMSVVFVTGIAITVPTLISLVGQLGGKNHGAAVSLYTFILFIGTSLGPIIAVSLLKTGSYLVTFVSLTLILGMGLAISFFIKKQ